MHLIGLDYERFPPDESMASVVERDASARHMVCRLGWQFPRNQRRAFVPFLTSQRALCHPSGKLETRSVPRQRRLG